MVGGNGAGRRSAARLVSMPAAGLPRVSRRPRGVGAGFAFQGPVRALPAGHCCGRRRAGRVRLSGERRAVRRDGSSVVRGGELRHRSRDPVRRAAAGEIGARNCPSFRSCRLRRSLWLADHGPAESNHFPRSCLAATAAGHAAVHLRAVSAEHRPSCSSCWCAVRRSLRRWRICSPWSLPPALVFTLPIGVLVGVLLASSRMSSDGEITAMRAAGISRPACDAGRWWFWRCWPCWRRRPVRCGSRRGPSAKPTGSPTVWRREQLTADIAPRVFQEQFPNTILFVADVVPGTVVRWKKVFLADLRPPGGSGARRAGGRRGSRGHGRQGGDRDPGLRPQPDSAFHDRRAAPTQRARTPPSTINISFPRRGSGAGGAAAQRTGARRAFRETDTMPLLRPGAETRWMPESSCIRGWRCRPPACCWRWWGFRWGSPRARPASPRRW